MCSKIQKNRYPLYVNKIIYLFSVVWQNRIVYCSVAGRLKVFSENSDTVFTSSLLENVI